MLSSSRNRGPYRFERAPDGIVRSAERGAGGVASALTPLLQGLPEPTTWVAGAFSADDRAAAAAGAVDGDGVLLDGVLLELVDVEPRLGRLYYDVVSNATLWFLHHGLFDLARRPALRPPLPRGVGGLRRGERGVRASEPRRVAADGDVVLVHDYQLSLVPGVLRTLRPDLRIVHFTHTPFCGPGTIRVLPDDVAFALCSSMATVPCGFHTERWARAYEASAGAVLGRDASIAGAFAAPLGPDAPALHAVAESAESLAATDELDALVGDRALLLRTDRIEPAKNIVRGFLAYDLLLELHPEWRGRVVFVAMLNPSREGLAEYLAYHQEVRQAAEQVNRRWATGGWQPVVLDERDDFARSVAGLGRYDVLLVNPLKDGMNLVAKEGPLLNRRDGVVCLSPEAGAYDELHDAVLAVHPYDLQQSAGALHRVLDDAAATSAPRWRAGCASSRARGRPRRLARRPPQAGRGGSALTRSVRSSARPGGPSTTMSARSISSAGASLDRTAIRVHQTDGSSTASSGGMLSSSKRSKTGRSPRSSPANATARIPDESASSASTAVPLSSGTGGRSSHAIRPGWVSRPWRAARSARASACGASPGAVRQWIVNAMSPLCSTNRSGQVASASVRAAATASR